MFRWAPGAELKVCVQLQGGIKGFRPAPERDLEELGGGRERGSERERERGSEGVSEKVSE